jgi:hypothetical protein
MIYMLRIVHYYPDKCCLIKHIPLGLIITLLKKYLPLEDLTEQALI